MEHARVAYSPLGKAFEKQTKTIEDQGQKQVDAFESLKPKEQKKQLLIIPLLAKKFMMKY